MTAWRTGPSCPVVRMKSLSVCSDVAMSTGDGWVYWQVLRDRCQVLPLYPLWLNFPRPTRPRKLKLVQFMFQLRYYFSNDIISKGWDTTSHMQFQCESTLILAAHMHVYNLYHTSDLLTSRQISRKMFFVFCLTNLNSLPERLPVFLDWICHKKFNKLVAKTARWGCFGHSLQLGWCIWLTKTDVFSSPSW